MRPFTRAFARLALPLLAAALPLLAAAPPPMTLTLDPHPPALPAGIPLRPGPPGHENWMLIDGHVPMVSNVTRPTLAPVWPSPRHPGMTAIVVAPGGGFLGLSMTTEGFDVAHWLAAHGVAAFVLKYRLKPTPPDPAGFMAAMGRMLGPALSGRPLTLADVAVTPEALADANDAVALVRAHAAEWGIDPHRVGLVGFSAGAITTLAAGLQDNRAARPDFLGVIYGPMLERPVPAGAPPGFLALAMNDPLFGHQGFALVDAYRAAHVPVELHAYEQGGHGFGMRVQGTSSDDWAHDFDAWARMHGWMPGAPGTD